MGRALQRSETPKVQTRHLKNSRSKDSVTHVGGEQER